MGVCILCGAMTCISSSSSSSDLLAPMKLTGGGSGFSLTSFFGRSLFAVFFASEIFFPVWNSLLLFAFPSLGFAVVVLLSLGGLFPWSFVTFSAFWRSIALERVGLRFLFFQRSTAQRSTVSSPRFFRGLLC